MRVSKLYEKNEYNYYCGECDALPDQYHYLEIGTSNTVILCRQCLRKFLFILESAKKNPKESYDR
jgi:predicted SprT family Zn-dependent metalloprotease